MSDDNVTRRDFLAGMATTGTAATLTNFTTNDARPEGGKIKVVCAEKLSEAEVQQIRAAAPNVELKMVPGRAELRNHVADAEVILGVVDKETMQAAKNLKWVQTWAAGVESLPRELMVHPSTLTNMQRVFAPVIAETAIGMMLSLTRSLTQTSIPAFKEHKWQAAQTPLTDLYQKTIGIVGMGGIGTETARRLHYGFEMKVLATDAKPMPKPAFVAELREPNWLMEMVPQVDILMSAAPHTKLTEKMFNDAVFSKMKPSAYFINVSRGGLVDNDALVRALKSKRIAGAGLDATTPEPLPADHPFWDCPNLVITPHNSGMAPIRQIRLMAHVTENVRRYAQGLPLHGVVDKVRGY